MLVKLIDKIFGFILIILYNIYLFVDVDEIWCIDNYILKFFLNDDKVGDF